MSNAFEKAIGYQVSMGCIGTRRKAAKGVVDITARNGTDDKPGDDPDKGSVFLAKDLFRCKELNEIRAFQGEVRRWIESRSLPSILRRGVYLIPLDLVSEVDEYAEGAVTKLDDLVDDFLIVYPSEVISAKKRLGVLWAQSDYPPSDVVRSAFYLKTAYHSFGVPGVLEGISGEIFKKEKLKAETQWKEATEQIRAVLRWGLKDLLDHMLDRLSSEDDGKPKVFRDSMVTNFQEYLQYFQPKNITDDTELSKLVESCKSVMEGVDPKTLRDDVDVQKDVAKTLVSVKSVMDTMVTERPSRGVML